MLVGENGCGKTAIINERIRTVCSGEVAEVLSLTLYANRFTNARLLFDRIDERLEWKHGKTFVPKGNKRLLCLVDDVNLSQTDAFGHQTACELIREHLDDGGFYSPTNHMWRYVKSVTYVTSVNPQTTANVPPISQRLLRHFAVFGCPYPSGDELKTIYSTLLNTHFFTPESATSSSSAQQFGLHDDRSHGGNVRFLEESLRTVMTSMVKVTVELSERMRSMFLPTAQRCHYFFTTRDLSTIFRNICLSLRPGCNKRNLLLLWQHEAFWVYGKRMVNEVDFRRFRQAFVTAVRKQFIDDDQIQTIIRPRSPLFTNLMEQDSGIVTAGMINTRVNQNISDEDAKTDLYRPAKSFTAVKDLLEKGVEEYNKIHPRIKMALYKVRKINHLEW
ncbi:dynein beta chain, ciliary [Elysia marginata]|uniref:Dynein beta chain, ciliary n=1 Tax=Elysia marginata TaxID=1093978 RepID=A0AAV4EM54_9GAST|nr:dynein beta chain, ciliary [Elysia marginata]